MEEVIGKAKTLEKKYNWVHIDQKILYLILILGASIPLLSPLKLPIPITKHTRNVWNVTEALSAGDMAIVSFDFGPDTLVENHPQAKAFVFHCKQLGLKVVGVTFWATGAPIGEDVFREVYGATFPDIPEYGQTVVYIGAIPEGEVGMRIFGDNTWLTISVDHFGNSFSDLPLMGEVRSAENFDIWMEVCSGNPGFQDVIICVQNLHGGPDAFPVVAAVTPQVASWYWWWSPQGYLIGLTGATEYEYLLNRDYDCPFAQGPILDAQSIAHIIVIVSVIIGNIGFAYSEFARARKRN